MIPRWHQEASTASRFPSEPQAGPCRSARACHRCGAGL